MLLITTQDIIWPGIMEKQVKWKEKKNGGDHG
jgi:hypothetical protein